MSRMDKKVKSMTIRVREIFSGTFYEGVPHLCDAMAVSRALLHKSLLVLGVLKVP